MSDILVAPIPQAFHHESREVPGQSYLEPKPEAVSDDLSNELYELLLLAFDQGQAVEGTTKLCGAVSNGQAELVVCAADVVQDFALDHVPALCESRGVLYV
ncbi:50S ribosomal protein L7Ae [Colletotrichum shisoi]|uniref:50S ribosomal protein L7Ae n=1 Tax=Colletotrichum shisoi TaxID=2078593 RepID=A0A5Q4BUQ3_9PEZI|nr:50S ribosomal protein L7Ae [Colletotrichum shisoi]